MAVRRAVLGDEHVDRAPRGRFHAEFQDLITRYAWGEIWTRRGLPRRTRSLVTLAAMVALDRSQELRLHLRAALRNGVTRDEIKEVLLQMAIYCGVPAAHAAFQLAAEVFAELDARGRKAKGRRRPSRARGPDFPVDASARPGVASESILRSRSPGHERERVRRGLRGRRGST